MKPKLLIVEDNELSSTLLFTIFESLDFDVKEIKYGDQVLPYLESNKVDVIILDLELPGMTGDQIYAAMKKDPKLSKIPIVPFTAHTDTQTPTSYASSLIWTEYRKSGKIPNIVYKFDETGDSKNITKEIIDEVARNLMSAGHQITKAMADYYMQTRGLKPEDIMNK